MLRIRNLSLRVVTDGGPICGVDFTFEDGLNILRADNSSGKSTCLQAILYGLGMEKMLSPRREIPLPHAMTDSISVGARLYRVRQSWVELGIENRLGERLYTRRFARDATRHADLIETSSGARGRDYFVGRPGAAQRTDGFHRQLVDFLGWQLPAVTKHDGGESLLYSECIFPYFFVEQKHGWSGIQARIPTYFGIRDVAKRSAEFVLSLEEYEIILIRQRLEYAGSVIESDWANLVRRVEGIAEDASVIVRGISKRPIGDRTRIEGKLVVPVGDSWRPIDEEITRLADELESHRAFVPEVSDDADNLEERLGEAHERLTSVDLVLRNAIGVLESARKRRVDIQTRIDTLNDDLQRHKDTLLLRTLGSRYASVVSGDSFCPTCHQALRDGVDVTNQPMSPDDNIAYIEQEIRTLCTITLDLSELVAAEESRVSKLNDDSAGIRREIRSLKDALTSPSATPSVASIVKRLQLDERRASLSRARDDAYLAIADMRSLSDSWRDNRQALKDLSARTKSSADIHKIEFMQRSIAEQLEAYHFSSLPPKSIEISRETYRPVHGGFDLGFDISASDMIRMIWAYLLGMAETGIRYNTNHARLLVLDEPRQQETQRLSFGALLARASDDGTRGAQIIFATSEEREDLRQMLKGLPHKLFDQPSGQMLIQPLSTA